MRVFLVRMSCPVRFFLSQLLACVGVWTFAPCMCVQRSCFILVEYILHSFDIKHTHVRHMSDTW